MDKKIILEDDPEAARFETTIQGWVSRGGLFCGNDEKYARWLGCTHKKCPICGFVYNRDSYCVPCKEKKNNELYQKREKVEWDEEYPVYSETQDLYFSTVRELMEYIEENVLNISDLKLLECEPTKNPQINMNALFQDVMPEHVDDATEIVPIEIQDKIDELNDLLSVMKPLSYQPTDRAIQLNL